MNRYQIYLDSQTVATVDDLAQRLDISRSRIIQDVVSRVAREYERIIAATVSSHRKNFLMKMAGFAKSPTGRVSLNIDEIYKKD